MTGWETWRRQILAFGLCLLLAIMGMAVSPSPSLAEESNDFDAAEVDADLPMKIKAWNGDCLSCHSQNGLAHPPRQGMDMGLLAKLLVSQSIFEQSDHKKMACKECHGEAYVPYPHLAGAKSKIKSCESCHQMPAKTIVPEFKGSAHLKDHSDKFTCLACHNAHSMRTGSKLGAPHMAATEDNGLCRNCHDDDLRFGVFKSKNKRPDMAKAHDWLPELGLHLAQLRCIDCHTPMSMGTLSHDVQVKEKAQRRCEACHAAESELGKRLYKTAFREHPEDRGGFINAGLLNETYVVGANRNLWLELGALAALILTAAVKAGPALYRWLKSLQQRKR